MLNWFKAWVKILLNYFGFGGKDPVADELTFQQRKTINIGWDANVFTGDIVSITADNPDDDSEAVEVRNVLNDGWATITFPQNYTGTCDVTVTDSQGNEQSGTVDII